MREAESAEVLEKIEPLLRGDVPVPPLLQFRYICTFDDQQNVSTTTLPASCNLH